MAGGQSRAGTIYEVRDESDWRRPSRRLLTLRRFEVAGSTILAVSAVMVVFSVVEEVLIGFAGAAGVIAGGLVAERVVQRRFTAWGYAEREDDLLVRRGVVVSRLSVVPYGRMQFIDVRAGPLERLLGLATVHMHTAAAARDARIPGLEHDEAARLRDRLAELGEAQAAGL